MCLYLTQCTCSFLYKEYANIFQTQRKWENKKNKTHNQFGFYSTRKGLFKSTIRFTLTLLALSVDSANLYHILWVPKD